MNTVIARAGRQPCLGQMKQVCSRDPLSVLTQGVFCTTKRLPKGPAVRPCWIPPTFGLASRLTRTQAIKPYRRLIPRQGIGPRHPPVRGAFLLLQHLNEREILFPPSPIDLRAYRRPLKPTHRAWSFAAPPAPSHAQTSGCLIPSQGSYRAPPDPVVISPKCFPTAISCGRALEENSKTHLWKAWILFLGRRFAGWSHKTWPSTSDQIVAPRGFVHPTNRQPIAPCFGE